MSPPWLEALRERCAAMTHTRTDLPAVLALVEALGHDLDIYGEHDDTCPALAWDNLRPHEEAKALPPPRCTCGFAEALARYHAGPEA